MMVIDTIFKLITDSLLNCTDHADASNIHEVPSAYVYLSKIDLTFMSTLILATLISITTVLLSVIHIIYILFYVTERYRRAFILYLAGTSPFVSIFAIISMYMPRIWFLAHLLGFLYFSIALWIIIRLLTNIFEGRQKMIKKMKIECSKITVQTPPFCCVFPCLPKLELETGRIRFCELMVFQAPCIRLICTIFSLILFFEYHNGAIVALKVLDFISLPSLLIGIYGTHILATAVSKMDELMPYRYIVVFRLLDFYFMFFGIQQPIFDFLARAGIFGCGTVLPPLETAFFWKNFLIVFESFFVSLISTMLLKPSRSALFDKYPSCRSSSSLATKESST